MRFQNKKKLIFSNHSTLYGTQKFSQTSSKDAINLLDLNEVLTRPKAIIRDPKVSKEVQNAADIEP